MSDAHGYRLVSTLEGAERERATSLLRGREAAWRRKAGLKPVPARQAQMCPHPIICRWVDEAGVEVCRACADEAGP